MFLGMMSFMVSESPNVAATSVAAVAEILNRLTVLIKLKYARKIFRNIQRYNSDVGLKIETNEAPYLNGRQDHGPSFGSAYHLGDLSGLAGVSNIQT